MSFDVSSMRVDRSRLLRVRDDFLRSIDYKPLYQTDYSYELISLVNMLEDLELDILDLERLDREGYFDDDYDDDDYADNDT